MPKTTDGSAGIVSLGSPWNWYGPKIGKKSIDVTSGRIGFSEMNKARDKLLKIRSVENMLCIPALHFSSNNKE